MPSFKLTLHALLVATILGSAAAGWAPRASGQPAAHPPAAAARGKTAAAPASNAASNSGAAGASSAPAAAKSAPTVPFVLPPKSVGLERVETTLPDGSKIVRMVPRSGSAGPTITDWAAAETSDASKPAANTGLAPSAESAKFHTGVRVSEREVVKNPAPSGAARVAGWRPDRAAGDASSAADMSDLDTLPVLGGPEAPATFREEGRLGEAWATNRAGVFRGNAPAAPTNLQVMDSGNGRDSKLRWQDNATTATGSLIERQTKLGATWGGAMTFTVGPTVEGLRDPAGAGDFRYRVAATNSVGRSEFTDWETVTVAAIAPSAPTDLKVAGSIPVLTWTDTSYNEGGFEVQRETQNGTAWTDTTDFAVALNAATYTQWPGVGTFRYRVRAFNEVGRSDYTAWASITTKDTPPNAPPTAPAAVSLSDGVHAKVTWNDNSINESAFEVSRAKQNGAGWNTPVVMKTIADAEELVDAPTDGVYRYRVRATNTAGASAYTDYVVVTIDATAPEIPSGLQGAVQSNLTQIKLSWNDNSLNEANFELNREKLQTDETWGGATTLKYGANVAKVTDSPGMGTYRYRVRSTNKAGGSNWTDWVTPTGAEVPPPAPSGLTLTDLGNSLQAKATWKDNSPNESGFELDREKQNGTVWEGLTTITIGADVTTWIDSPGLGTFHYRVRAVNASGDSANTAWVAITVKSQPPSAPTDLYAADAGTGVAAIVTWTDTANNETGIELVREKMSGTTWINPVTYKFAANTTEFIDSPGTGTFHYHARAVNTAGSSAYTAWSEVTIALGTPNAPSDLAASDLGTRKALVSWKDQSNNETGFQVERTPPFLNGSSKVNVDANVEGYVDASGPGTFTYKVSAYNANGSSASIGPVSVTVKDNAPTAPSNLTATDAGNETQARLAWSDNSDNEASFIIERETASGTSWVAKQTLSAAKNAVAFTDSPGGGKHHYRIAATNTDGTSAFTGWSEVTISSGWTQFSPSTDTRMVYVSSSGGNDSNDGLSEAKPKKTLAGGIKLLRHKYPDWLLLKRGDVWDEVFGQWKLSGRSSLEPMVVSTYGTSPDRPLIRAGGNDCLYMQGGSSAPDTNEHLAFVGLHLWGNGRSGTEGNSGFKLLRSGQNILLEDCVIQAFKDNLNLHGGTGFDGFKIRRCLILDAFSSNSAHAQGLYCEYMVNMVVEDSIFDHNGWKEGVAGAEATIFNHNFYLRDGTRNTTIRRCIITRSSSHGVNLNASGTIQDCLFVQNPVAIFVRTMPGVARGNVILESRDIAADLPRGFGIIVGSVPDFATDQVGPCVVENNIIAHKSASTTGRNAGIQFSSNKPPLSATLTVQNNVVYDWRGTSIDIGDPKSTPYDLTTVKDNVFMELNYDSYIGVVGMATFPKDRITMRGNRYQTPYQTKKWFFLSGSEQSFSQWQTTSGETGVSGATTFKDANVSMAGYMTKLGLTGSLDSFLGEARKQSRMNWRENFRAENVIAYFRDGFTRN